MINAIQKIAENTYYLEVRGNKMTLKLESGGWKMYTVNAAVNAWNRGYAIPKHFDSLGDVEKKYKTWTGITELVECDVTAGVVPN